MDMMDSLDSSPDGDEIVESKVILKETIVGAQGIESDDEHNVGILSPQTLLETPGEHEVQYSLRSPDGLITYRVLQVEDGNTAGSGSGNEGVPQIVTTSGNFSASNVQQVLTSNLNGQVYVIGNPNEVFTAATAATHQSGTRAIAPRTSASSIVDNSGNTVVTNIKRRDERRRATHNEVERRRRDKINNWITKLSKIIPETMSPEMKGNGGLSGGGGGGGSHYDGQSKGGILEKACEYILELRENEQQCELFARENEQLLKALEGLKQTNASLERENRTLKELLKRNGIEVVHSNNSASANSASASGGGGNNNSTVSPSF